GGWSATRAARAVGSERQAGERHPQRGGTDKPKHASSRNEHQPFPPGGASSAHVNLCGTGGADVGLRRQGQMGSRLGRVMQFRGSVVVVTVVVGRGTVVGGSVTGGSVIGGSVTGGSVTGGSMTGVVLSGGSVMGGTSAAGGSVTTGPG